MGPPRRGYKISNAQSKRRGRGTPRGEKRGPYRKRRKSLKTLRNHWRVSIFVWVRHATPIDLFSPTMRWGASVDFEKMVDAAKRVSGEDVRPAELEATYRRAVERPGLRPFRNGFRDEVDWERMADAWKRAYGEDVRPHTLEQRYRRAVNDQDLQPVWNLLRTLGLYLYLADESLLPLRTLGELPKSDWKHLPYLKGRRLTEWPGLLAKLEQWPSLAKAPEEVRRCVSEAVAPERRLPRTLLEDSKELFRLLSAGYVPRGYSPAAFSEISALIATALYEFGQFVWHEIPAP